MFVGVFSKDGGYNHSKIFTEEQPGQARRLIKPSVIIRLAKLVHEIRNPLNSLLLISQRSMQAQQSRNDRGRNATDRNWRLVEAATSELTEVADELAKLILEAKTSTSFDEQNDVFLPATSNDELSSSNSDDSAVNSKEVDADTASKRNALLVSTDTNIITAVEKSLSSMEFETIVVLAGECFDVVQRVNPALVLVDFEYPGRGASALRDCLSGLLRPREQRMLSIVPTESTDIAGADLAQVISREALYDQAVSDTVFNEILSANWHVTEAADYHDSITFSVGAKNKKVLFVSQRVSDVFKLASMLRASNYDVSFVSEGSEFKKALDADPAIDVIVVSISENIACAYDNISAVRTSCALRSVPVIALLERISCERVQLILHAGASECWELSTAEQVLGARVQFHTSSQIW